VTAELKTANVEY